MASAVSDGGGSLEATHQGDAIARVRARWCLYGRVSLHVPERKRAMLSYVFAAAYKLRSEPRSSIFPPTRMHMHVRPLGEVKKHGSAPLLGSWIGSQA